MSTRTLKLLTATTAFVAASSAASAVDTISTVTTTTVHISNTSAGTLTVNALISTTAAPAIDISRTGAVIINNNATIRSHNTSTTIQLEADTGVTGLTINNSGSIISTNDTAILSDELNADGNPVNVTINNHGTISGTVAVRHGDLTYTAVNATQSGNITSENGNDTYTLTNSTVTGDITAGDGTNTLTATGSTITGSYTGGAGADNVTLTNTTVTGTGNTLNGGGSGADVLTINGTNTYTVNTGGAGIMGFETVNFNTSVNLNQGLQDVNALTLAAGKTLTVNNSFATASSGSITNNGILNIASGKTVATDTFNAGAGSSFQVGIASSTQAGQLRITGGGTSADTSATINMGSNAGYITSGTSYVLVQDVDTGATLGDVAILNANTGVYRFSTSTNNGNVSLTVGRVAMADVVTGADAKSVGNALDTIGASATGQLRSVQSAIGQAGTAGEVQNVLNGLTPSIDGAGMASINVTVDTANQVSNRLASLRSTSGVATGDPMASSHMWIEGFGSTVDQDNDSGNSGYDANSGGMSVGVDSDTFIEGTTTGMALSYGRSTVESKSTNNANTDIDSYVATLYGSRVLDGGLFVNGQVGVGLNRYEMERNVAGVGTAKGETDGLQGSAKVEIGQDLGLGGFTFTPLASLQYTYLKMDEYTETGVGNAGLTVDPDAMSTFDAGLGFALAYAIPLIDGGTLKPSVHAKYIYRMGDRELATTSSFLGAAGTSFNTTGVEADDSSINLGAGLLLTTVGGTDLSFNYDADVRSSLTGHTGQLKARWAF